LACLEAEKILARSNFGPCAVILRLAGIYGPGRLLRRTQALIAGNPIVVPKDGYLNLIHIDDAAAIVKAAEIKAKTPCTYIVADGYLVKYHEYITYLAKFLGLPNPRLIEPMCPSIQTRYATNKRLSNVKMLSELAIKLRYPTYKEGLEAIFSSPKR
jgi:nucleoside-diphosphate-sugar epimerase